MKRDLAEGESIRVREDCLVVLTQEVMTDAKMMGIKKTVLRTLLGPAWHSVDV